jgi:hypothetical protein
VIVNTADCIYAFTSTIDWILKYYLNNIQSTITHALHVRWRELVHGDNWSLARNVYASITDSSYSSYIVSLLSLARETLARETLARETLAGETLAGETLAGETLAGESLAGETLAGETLARETLAGETLAGETLARETIARETLTRETLARETLTRLLLDRSSSSYSSLPRFLI